MVKAIEFYTPLHDNDVLQKLRTYIKYWEKKKLIFGKQMALKKLNFEYCLTQN